MHYSMGKMGLEVAGNVVIPRSLAMETPLLLIAPRFSGLQYVRPVLTDCSGRLAQACHLFAVMQLIRNQILKARASKLRLLSLRVSRFWTASIRLSAELQTPKGGRRHLPSVEVLQVDDFLNRCLQKGRQISLVHTE